MMRIGTSPWAALAGALALAAPAFAAETEASPTTLEAALQAADERFVAGDLPGALAILEPACSESERPECLFSLGAIQHGLGHCAQALDYYRRYRQVAPRGEQIDEVTTALEEVEGRCGAAARAEPAGVTPGGRAAGGVAAGGVAAGGVATTSVGELPASPAANSPAPGAAAPAPLSSPSALTSELMVGSFALSGATALSSVVFGALAAQAAHDCQRARRYDESFRDACEVNGPRYQGLWQGFALASASFLGIGITLWWIDSNSTATLGVSGAGTPVLHYRREF